MGLIAPSPGQIAQSVEQRTENPRVGGSIPPLATRKINHLVKKLPFPIFLRVEECRSKEN